MQPAPTLPRTGSVMSNTATALRVVRSSPTNASVRPATVKIAMPSGSTPLSSLRLSGWMPSACACLSRMSPLS